MVSVMCLITHTNHELSLKNVKKCITFESETFIVAKFLVFTTLGFTIIFNTFTIAFSTKYE